MQSASPPRCKKRGKSNRPNRQLAGELRTADVLGSRAIEKQENKSMQPLNGIVMAMLAGTVILAQQPNTPAANKPPIGDPGAQAAQTPPAQSKTSMATPDANSRNFTGTLVDANCSQASSLTARYSAA